MKLLANAGKRVRRGAALLAVTLSTFSAISAVVPTTALAAITDQVPMHEKTLTDNGDGTYDLSLTVKGASEQSSQTDKVDVIVVQDVTGSMDDLVDEVPMSELDKSKQYWGYIGNSSFKIIVPVKWGEYQGQPRWVYQRNQYWYDYIKDCRDYGIEAKFYSSERTRLEVAKSALNTLADQLIADENSDVQISLVKLAIQSTADGRFYKGGESEEFKSMVDDLSIESGTNWENALINANSLLSKGRDDAKKCIVFISDGLPTFRTSQGNYVQGSWYEGGSFYFDASGEGGRFDDRYYPKYESYGTSVWGFGVGDTLGRCFDAAVDEANRRGDGVAMYSVGIFGDVARMQEFADKTESTYLDGSSEQSLKAAYQKIANSITKSASYEDVKIVDQLSDYVDFADDDAVNVRYEKLTDEGATAWDEAPEAEVDRDDGTLTWDLADVGALENGVTYKVTFTVKPNQAAYDAAAAAGALTKLPSNDADNTKVTYTAVASETGKEDEKVPGSAGYGESPTFAVPVDTVTVTKAWTNDSESDRPASVTVQLKKDGQKYGDPFQLTAADGWTKTISVPAGVGQLTWSVTENAVAGYTTAYSDAVTGSGTLTVTNTREAKKTDPKTDPKKNESKNDGTDTKQAKKQQKKVPATGDVLLAGGAVAAMAGTGALGVVASAFRRRKK